MEIEQALKKREMESSGNSISKPTSLFGQTQSSFEEREFSLNERERLLKEEEEKLEKANEDLDNRRADLERKWLNWRDGERLQKDEEIRKVLIERDSARNALEEHLRMFGDHHQGQSQVQVQVQAQGDKKATSRRVSNDQNHPVGTSKRPVLTKRISSGHKMPRSSNSNISMANITNSASNLMNLDQTDVSMLNIRERVRDEKNHSHSNPTSV